MNRCDKIEIISKFFKRLESLDLLFNAQITKIEVSLKTYVKLLRCLLMSAKKAYNF